VSPDEEVGGPPVHAQPAAADDAAWEMDLSAELVELFDDVSPDVPAVERPRMLASGPAEAWRPRLSAAFSGLGTLARWPVG